MFWCLKIFIFLVITSFIREGIIREYSYWKGNAIVSRIVASSAVAFAVAGDNDDDVIMGR